MEREVYEELKTKKEVERFIKRSNAEDNVVRTITGSLNPAKQE